MKAAAILAIVVVIAVFYLNTEQEFMSDEENNSKVMNCIYWCLEFIKVFKRDYKTEEEYKYRLSVFIKNLLRMEEMRIRNPRAKFGVNHFADRTAEEMTENFGFVPSKKRNAHSLKTKKPITGTNVDWSSMWPTIKNQGSCGSCWAFSAIGAVESRYAISKGSKSIDTLYSEQQLVDCVKACKGCKGGDMNDAFNYLMKSKLCLESEYPYIAKQSTCVDSTCQGPNVKGHSQFGYEDEQGITQGLSQGPISVAVDASSWSAYYGGILDDDFCFFELNHGVTLVAANFDEGSVTIRNSWGGSWGEGGHIRLAMNKNMCGYAEQASVPNF